MNTELKDIPRLVQLAFALEPIPDKEGCTTRYKDVVDNLKAGTPPIWTRVKDGEDHIEIHIFGLKPGEEDLVGKRIADIFK